MSNKVSFRLKLWFKTYPDLSYTDKLDETTFIMYFISLKHLGLMCPLTGQKWQVGTNLSYLTRELNVQCAIDLSFISLGALI